MKPEGVRTRSDCAVSSSTSPPAKSTSAPSSSPAKTAVRCSVPRVPTSTRPTPGSWSRPVSSAARACQRRSAITRDARHSTAPSFGTVHARKGDGSCQPGRLRFCKHGRVQACSRRHDVADPEIGSPLCDFCYRFADAVLWNAESSRLWNRTFEQIRRRLATHLGVRFEELAQHARLNYLKVAEFQASWTCPFSRRPSPRRTGRTIQSSTAGAHHGTPRQHHSQRGEGVLC